MLHKLWGGPPGPGGTPFVPLLPRESGPCRDEEPARGPALDQGVRPTTYASVRSWEKLVALGESPAAGAASFATAFTYPAWVTHFSLKGLPPERHYLGEESLNETH